MENFNKQFEEWKQKHQQKKDMEYLGAVAMMLKDKEMFEIYSNNGVKVSVLAISVSFVCKYCGKVVDSFSSELVPCDIKQKRKELLKGVTKTPKTKTLKVKIPCHCGKINEISYDICTTEDDINFRDGTFLGKLGRVSNE